MSNLYIKVPFVSYTILKKLNSLKKKNIKEVIKTWSRASTIIPEMVGYTFSIYNGRKHIPLFISDYLVGHKLGEFVPTRTFYAHKGTNQKIKNQKKDIIKNKNKK